MKVCQICYSLHPIRWHPNMRLKCFLTPWKAEECVVPKGSVRRAWVWASVFPENMQFIFVMRFSTVHRLYNHNLISQAQVSPTLEQFHDGKYEHAHLWFTRDEQIDIFRNKCFSICTVPEKWISFHCWCWVCFFCMVLWKSHKAKIRHTGQPYLRVNSVFWWGPNFRFSQFIYQKALLVTRFDHFQKKRKIIRLRIWLSVFPVSTTTNKFISGYSGDIHWPMLNRPNPSTQKNSESINFLQTEGFPSGYVPGAPDHYVRRLTAHCAAVPPRQPARVLWYGCGGRGSPRRHPPQWSGKFQPDDKVLDVSSCFFHIVASHDFTP